MSGPSIAPAGLPPPAPRHAVASEAARKVAHVGAAAAAAAVVWIVPPLPARGVLLGAACLALAIDFARLLLPRPGRLFERLFGSLLRQPERHRLTGASRLAVGCAAAALLFPRSAAMGGILYAGIADAAGAVVGRTLGRRHLARGRTLEGSLAFLASAFLVGWALPGMGPLAALLAAVALTVLEALPLPIDDNLLLPVAGALIVYVLSVAP